MTYLILLFSLFALTALVGIAVLLNGLRGVVFKSAYAPDLTGSNKKALRSVSGAEASRLGRYSLLVGLPFVVLAFWGINLTIGFFNSPAYVRHLLPPPDGYELVYTSERQGIYEIAYGFQVEREEIYKHFMRKLENRGWQIASDTKVLILARKGSDKLSIMFIGRQVGDNKTYKSKVIIIYRRGFSPS